MWTEGKETRNLTHRILPLGCLLHKRSSTRGEKVGWDRFRSKAAPARNHQHTACFTVSRSQALTILETRRWSFVVCSMANIQNAVPKGALTAVALVLIYSVFCLSASALLAIMLWKNGERTSCKSWPPIALETTR